jgi:pantothenate synthetase
MSSRNSYLDPREREEASGLHRALEKARAAFREGERGPESLRAVLEKELTAYPSLCLQYGEVVHPETLEPVDPVMPGSVMAVAAFCGRTRLIDNLILGA